MTLMESFGSAATLVPPAGRPLVEVRDLGVSFVSREATVKAVNGVSFELMPGEVLCIIGESGSGKSVTMRSLMRLHPKRRTVMSGSMRVGDHDILSLSDREMNSIRGRTVSMVFQEPMTALDPVYSIGDQIAETVMRHEKCSRADAMKRALELLEFVKVPSPERRLKAFPHELSGGLRQRAMIAVALSCRPSLLLADEPTTALDATVQIQVLILLRKLQKEFGMAIILVTHDLGVAAQIADKVAVMYAGRIVEYGKVRDVLMNPAHPYTRGMLASTVHGQAKNTEIETIPGSPPDLRFLPPGCSFSPRCKYVLPECIAAVPPPIANGPDQVARCIRVGELPQTVRAGVA
ncbi:peptide/nickel transport system ATP-binding protein [Faunimonas pinastri]|uniref:Peptide/nickel transport system ATP-binding protein n=1 Tax=Faunimonas pinastri TaxID=1855383 RepID=A0A1H9E5Z8_9HYPH|nr:ABC transporter ATP-binding protein [Faunimonas pinastri]SEQ21089.1 peptide/nickel transport system ATP-binding protein [Faunimonas pinastri]